MRQGVFTWSKRGGKRKGAGRKRCGRRRVPHVRRCTLKAEHPVHITLRVLDDVGRLRRGRVFQVLRQVMLLVAQREAQFRIAHLSVQGNHLHLICEASDRRALSSGIRAFKISFARRLNAVLGRRGSVFSDRYHEEVLTSPTQVRNCIAYVLNNWRKHGEDRGTSVRLDPYATGAFFPGWAERASFRYRTVSTDEILPRKEPRSWLLREGWKRARPISLYEVPGQGSLINKSKKSGNRRALRAV